MENVSITSSKDFSIRMQNAGMQTHYPRKIRMRSLSQHQRENLEWVEHVIVDGHELSGNLFQSTDL